MDGVGDPAFAAIRALRDQLELRIRESEDFRALTALERELAAFEQSAAPPPELRRAEPAMAIAESASASGFPADFDLDEWTQVPAGRETTRRWWQRRAG